MLLSGRFASPIPYLPVLLALIMVASPAASRAQHAVKISDTEGGFEGELDNGDHFGSSVAVVGDLDRDGIPDLAVGAPGASTSGIHTGTVWILRLTAGGTVKAHQEISTGRGGFDQILGSNAKFGESLAPIGDLNGDGTPDLAVSGDGNMWILFLEPDGRVQSLRTYWGQPSTSSFNVNRIGMAGDRNGDGTGDLLTMNPDGVRIVLLGSAGNVLTRADTGISGVSNCNGVDDLDEDGIRELGCGTYPSRFGIHVLDHSGVAISTSNIDMGKWGYDFNTTLSAGHWTPLMKPSLMGRGGLRGLVVGAAVAENFRGAAFRLFLNKRLELVARQDLATLMGDYRAPGVDFETALADGDFFGSGIAVADLDGSGLEEVFVGARGDDDGGNNDFADRGAVWVLFNAALPAPGVMSADVVGSTEIEKPIQLSSRIYDVQGVDQARTHFRRGGDPSFFSAPMTEADETTFTFDVPGFVVGPRGVEYYVTASNVDGAEGRWPEAGFGSISVRMPQGVSRAAPVGTAADGYRLVSLPLSLESTDARAMLEKGLGTYSPKKWRFFQHLPSTGENRGLDQYEIEIRPGLSYWLLVKDANRMLQSGPGTTVASAQPFRLGLDRDFNFVANPYNFPVTLDHIANASGRTLRQLIEDGLVDEVLTYQGDWVTVSDTLMPFEGYVIYPQSECIDSIECDDVSPGALYVYSDPTMIPKTGEATKRHIVDETLWSIRISARQGVASDAENYAAVSSTAQVGFDPTDRPEPPVIGDYVSVSFPHPEWGRLATSYRRDTRPEPTKGDVWPIEVRTRTYDPVELRFEGLDEVPPRFEVWLVDERAGVRKNLQEDPAYELAGPGEEHPAELALAVGTHQYVTDGYGDTRPLPESPNLLPIYPNPFSGTATIRYVLPEAMSVRIDVVDVLGRRVTTLRDGSFDSAGYHALVWDGRGHSGASVAGGLYFVRLHLGKWILSRSVVRTR